MDEGVKNQSKKNKMPIGVKIIAALLIILALNSVYCWVSFFIILIVIGLVIAIFDVVISINLWRGKNWARILSIIIGIIVILHIIQPIGLGLIYHESSNVPHKVWGYLTLPHYIGLLAPSISNDIINISEGKFYLGIFIICVALFSVLYLMFNKKVKEAFRK